MPIHHWPQADQPRQKLLQHGASALTDAELIAITINSGHRQQSALDLAKLLLKQIGTLKNLALSPRSQLLQLKGLGPAKYAILQAALELGRRSLADTPSAGQKLSSSALTQAYVANQLSRHANEVFACLYLDTHLRFIAFEELFYGTVNQANVYPREIVRRCLHHNAAKLVLAHNHPSGLPIPSDADREITQLLVQTLAAIDVAVIDHIIVGHAEHFSFAEMGLI